MDLKGSVMEESVRSTEITTYQLTKTLQFITRGKVKLDIDPQTFKLANPTDKPLCVMFTWMFAKLKYIMKYVHIYLEQDFDVLTVGITALHVIWPTRGIQVTAANVVKFLHNNNSTTPITLHGFSSGPSIWAEVLVFIDDNEKYKPILKRISAQVWDSLVDYTSLQYGVPRAMFPKYKFMQNVAKWVFELYMKLLHNIMLTPVMRGSDIFRNEPSLAPALIFASLSDEFCCEPVNRFLSERWTSLGIKVTFKCWEISPHVQHMAKHPKEYFALLYNHMDQVGLLKNKEIMNARLNESSRMGS